MFLGIYQVSLYQSIFATLLLIGFCLLGSAALGESFPGGYTAEWRVKDMHTDHGFMEKAEASDRLGLELRARFDSDGFRWRSSCEVHDTLGEERAIVLALCVPIDEAGWSWWDDPNTARPIEKTRIYANLIEEYFGYAYQGSQYPLAVIANQVTGIALAVPLDPPRNVRFLYDAEKMEFRAEFDLGLSPIPEHFSSRADATVIGYKVQPDWPFRRALETYHALHPDAFQRRAKRGGTFLTKTPIDTIQKPEDFGFAWHDFAAQHLHMKDPAIDLGVKPFVYREPQTDWRTLRDDVEPTYEAYVTQLEVDAHSGDRHSQATIVSGIETQVGKMDLYLEPIVWTRSAPFGVNACPSVPTEGYDDWPNKGQYELESLAPVLGWDDHPYTGMAGIFFDSMEGWSNILNYRKEHWRATRYPLTFNRRDDNAVCLSNLWGNHAMARAYARRLREHDQLMMGNGAFHFLWQFAPYVDIPGREYTWYQDGEWTPVSDERFLFLRSMAATRPIWMLMNNSFDLEPEHMEAYFQRCLFYGVFPSMFHAHDGESPWYWATPQYYERDRPFFVRYLPYIHKLDNAGWQPVPYARSSIEGVQIERFGAFDSGLAFTVHNPDAIPHDVTIEMDRDPLGIPESAEVCEWITGETPAVDSDELTMRIVFAIPAEGYAAIGIGPALSPGGDHR